MIKESGAHLDEIIMTVGALFFHIADGKNYLLIQGCVLQQRPVGGGD